MYKVQNNCSPDLMNKVFPQNEPIYEYGLRNTSDFAARRIKTVRHGSFIILRTKIMEYFI